MATRRSSRRTTQQANDLDAVSASSESVATATTTTTTTTTTSTSSSVRSKRGAAKAAVAVEPVVDVSSKRTTRKRAQKRPRDDDDENDEEHEHEHEHEHEPEPEHAEDDAHVDNQASTSTPEEGEQAHDNAVPVTSGTTRFKSSVVERVLEVAQVTDVDQLVSLAVSSLAASIRRLQDKSTSHTGAGYDDGEADLSATLDAYAAEQTNPELEKLLKHSLVGDQYQRPPANEHRDKKLKRKAAKDDAANTSGKGWFNLKSAPLTAENKRDLEVLQLRPYIFKDRHIKRNDRSGAPEFFQVGRVVAGAHDFYASRMPKSQQKRTFVEELVADASFTQYAKKKFREKQLQSKPSHSHGHKRQKTGSGGGSFRKR